MTSEIVTTTYRRALEPSNLSEAKGIAQAAAASKLFGADTPEKAFALILVGRDLGLSAAQSLRGIYLVQGRPTLAADTMVAVVRSSGLCDSWRTVESTAEKCTIETSRRGEGPTRKTWTIEDARRAKLADKEIWKAYPAQMLRHRCASELAREVYPDVLMGVYAEGELEPEPATRVVVERLPVEAVAKLEDPKRLRAIEWIKASGLKKLLENESLERLRSCEDAEVSKAYAAKLSSLLSEQDDATLRTLPLASIPEALASHEVLRAQLDRLNEREPGAEG